MKFPIPIIMTFLVFLIQSLDGDPVSDWKEFSTNWGAVFEKSGDVISTLKKISKSSKYLLALGGPIGALVAAGITATWEPKSAEEKAIILVHEEMSYRLKEMSKEFQQLFNKNRMLISDYEFQNKIQSPLDHLGEAFKQVTSPVNSTRRRAADFFQERCTEELQRSKVLVELQRMFIENCRGTSSRGYQNRYNKIIQALYALESSHTDSGNDDLWTDAVHDFRYYLHLLDAERARYVLDQLEAAKGSSRSSSAQLLQKLTALSSPSTDSPHLTKNNTCRLSAAFDAGHHRREVLFDVLEELVIQIKRILLYTPACGFVLMGDDKEGRIDFENRINEKLTELSDFVVLWAKEAFKSDWPHGAAVECERELGIEFPSGQISIDEYNKSAEVLRASYGARGESKYEYQIIVSRKLTWGPDYHIMSLNNEILYSVIDKHPKITAFAFRNSLDEKSQHRLYRGRSWFESKRKAFIEDFRNFTRDTRDVGATVKMRLLDEVEGHLLASNRHHSAIYFSLNGTTEDLYLLRTGEAFSNDLVDKEGARALSVELFEHSFWFFTDDHHQKLFIFA